MLNGSCTVSSAGCFYSPLFPLPYPQFATCELEALADGSLHVESFSTEVDYDVLTVRGVGYSGTNGPDNVDVTQGDVLTFITDAGVVATGFQICYSVLSSGGGVFIGNGGTLDAVNTTFEGNHADRLVS